jgi:hypothetical protein
MMLPMFGLLTVLIVIGGLASIVATGDPHHARPAPYIGFVCLFAGLGALLFSVVLTWVGEYIFQSHSLAGLGLFGGYAVGGLGGAYFGLKRAIKRRQQIDSGLL